MVSQFLTQIGIQQAEKAIQHTPAFPKKKKTSEGTAKSWRRLSRDPLGIDETWLAAYLSALKQCLLNMKPFK